MLMTRLLLGLEVVVMFLAQWFVIQTNWSRETITILGIFFTTLMITGLTMFLFSFVRVDKTPTGALCFNPQNPYWRFMKWIYPGSWEKQMSLCKTHWMTELIVMGATIFSILMFIAWEAGFWETLKIIFIIALLGIATLIAILVTWIVLIGFKYIFDCIGRKQWYQSHKKICDVVIVGCLSSGGLGGVIAFAMYDQKVDFVMALLIVLQSIVGLAWFCAIIGGLAVGIIFVVSCFLNFVMKSKEFREKTAIGQALNGIKENFCPTLYECGVEKTQK